MHLLAIVASCAAAVSATGTKRRLQFAMDDTTIRTAVAAWLSDASAAEATYGHISTWDTSGVTSMDQMFFYASSFNQDIGGWAVDSVTSMYGMFYYASALNQDLGWCVDDGVSLSYAFDNTPCASTSCGVVQVADVAECPTPALSTTFAPTFAPPPTTPAPTATPAPTVTPLVADDTTIRTAVAAWLLS